MSVAIQQFFYRLQDEDRGAGLAEYALILVLISIVAIVTLGPLGDTIAGVFEDVDTAITNGSGGGGGGGTGGGTG